MSRTSSMGAFRMAGIATPSTEYIADSEPENPALLCTLRYNILVPRPGIEMIFPKLLVMISQVVWHCGRYISRDG